MKKIALLTVSTCLALATPLIAQVPAEFTSLYSELQTKYLKPDYLLLQSEPDTEANNLPPNLGNQFTNAAADMNMVSNFLNDLQTAGLRSTNMIVGAGCGTWQEDFTNFLAGFTNLAGLDLLSIHVYQITVHQQGH